MSKVAICPRTGKPHRWRLDPNIKHVGKSETGQMINFHYKCADCPAKHVFRNLLDRAEVQVAAERERRSYE